MQNEQGLAARLGELLLARQQRVTTAESCTGGGIAAAITAIAGSSAWFDQAIVTYSNEAKARLLGVPSALLQVHGAVSEPVAAAMAEGARTLAAADWAVSVTGIAGPGGATPGKPVGMVCFGLAQQGSVQTTVRYFDGDREAVRQQAVCHALNWLCDCLSGQ